jgi:hypothetical protein
VPGRNLASRESNLTLGTDFESVHDFLLRLSRLPACSCTQSNGWMPLCLPTDCLQCPNCLSEPDRALKIKGPVR